MLAGDLEACAEAPNALIIELPTRENGGRLPAWDELAELCALARSRGMRVHLDGARIWEAQAAYDRPFSAIAELFDSIYVSFYKGIGALPGAMLLGSRPFIDEARVWQRRMGGQPLHLAPERRVGSEPARREAAALCRLQRARSPSRRRLSPRSKGSKSCRSLRRST